MTTLLAGLAFGLSLIVVIGAQNSFVLRIGLTRQHVLTVVSICVASDVALIAVGIAGAGAALSSRPWLLHVVRFGGAAFLLGYGALAARRALRPGVRAAEGPWVTSLAAAVSTALALTWLNPGVYLDTVVLLGSVAHTRTQPWSFGAGAALGSVLWFFALGYGARLLSAQLTRPRAWQALDASVAVVMLTTAVRVMTG